MKKLMGMFAALAILFSGLVGIAGAPEAQAQSYRGDRGNHYARGHDSRRYRGQRARKARARAYRRDARRHRAVRSHRVDHRRDRRYDRR